MPDRPELQHGPSDLTLWRACGELIENLFKTNRLVFWLLMWRVVCTLGDTLQQAYREPRLRNEIERRIPEQAANWGRIPRRLQSGEPERCEGSVISAKAPGRHLSDSDPTFIYLHIVAVYPSTSNAAVRAHLELVRI